MKCRVRVSLAIFCWLAAPIHAAPAQDGVILSTYTCTQFTTDVKEPADGTHLLRSLMMIAWASGYAAAHQEGTLRADPAAIQLISAALGDACRKSPNALAVKAISDAILELTKPKSSDSTIANREIDSRTNPSDSDLRARTAAFLNTLYAAESRSAHEIIAMMKDTYAEQVEYFGKTLSRDEVLTLLSRYIERWPKRKYTPRSAFTEIQCDDTSRTCKASGILDFDASSTARNERSTGSATFEFTLSYANSTAPLIVREAGSTLERKRLPVATAPETKRRDSQ